MAIRRSIELTIDGNGRSAIVDLARVKEESIETICVAVQATQNTRRIFSFVSDVSLDDLLSSLKATLSSLMISPLPDKRYLMDLKTWVKDTNREYSEVVGLLMDYIPELDEHIVNNDTEVQYEIYQSDYFTLTVRLMHEVSSLSSLNGIVTAQLMFVGKGDFKFTDLQDRTGTKRLAIHRHFTMARNCRERLSEFLNKQRLSIRDRKYKALFESDAYMCSIELDEIIEELFVSGVRGLRKTIEGKLFDVIVMFSLN